MSEANKPNAGFDRFQVWREYEGVAMHFNDLIIRLRSQSLGGVAAAATLAAVVARNDTTAELRWGLLTGAFALLCIFWVAVWILDSRPCRTSPSPRRSYLESVGRHWNERQRHLKRPPIGACGR